MCDCVFCGEVTCGTAGLPGGDPALCPGCLREQKLEILEDVLASSAVFWGDVFFSLDEGDGAEAPALAPY